MKYRHVVTILAMAGIMAPSVDAQTPLVTGFTGGTHFSTFFGGTTGDVVGFRFTADSNIMLTHLGIYDQNRNAGDPVLNSPHSVGIWENTGQTLLGSVTVDSSGLHVGEFYYSPLGAAVSLTAGQQYTLGSLHVTGDLDTYISGPTSISLDQISGTVGVSPTSTSLGFVYPAVTGTNLARLGPNALYVIPEPASLVTLLVGLGLLFAQRRR
jgi:hypothetical protein